MKSKKDKVVFRVSNTFMLNYKKHNIKIDVKKKNIVKMS